MTGLFFLLFFNAPYKLAVWNNLINSRFYIALDTLNSSLTMSMVLFINLVVSHSLSASLEMNKKVFYMPKLIICALVLFSMWVWQYADRLNYLAYFENEFEKDLVATESETEVYNIFLMFMIFYWLMALYYCFQALTVKPDVTN